MNKAKDFSSEQSQKLKKLSEKEPQAPSKAKAEEEAESAGSFVNNFFSKAKDLGSAQPWEKLAFQLQKPPSEESNVQVATVRGQAKARALPSKKAAVRQPQTNSNSKPPFAVKAKENSKPKGKEEGSKAEVRKVFGGLFSQETIYVDDD